MRKRAPKSAKFLLIFWHSPSLADYPALAMKFYGSVKGIIALLLVLLLMYAGFRGRQHARLQARLQDITIVRDQLQRTLDGSQKTAEQAADLKARLQQFESIYSAGELSAVESLDLRSSKATLANAEQRFADALTMVTAQDAKDIRALQVRGDAFYGLGRRQEALDHYRQLLTLQPDGIAALTRAAECLSALGKLDEALTTYAELANRHNRRGSALLVGGKLVAAGEHYEKALHIQTRLVEQGRPDLAEELARSYQSVANALLTQQKPDASGAHYQKAIEIQTGLGVRSDLADELAMNHHHLGNALLPQQKLDAAVEQYEKAIEIRSRLFEAGRSELSSELAMSYNNRGVVRRAQSKLDEAIADFEKAIQLSHSGPARVIRHDQVKLEVAMAYSEKSIEALIRTRLFKQAEQSESAIARATSLKNRGHVRLAQGKADAALGDFKQAVDIYGHLVAE